MNSSYIIQEDSILNDQLDPFKSNIIQIDFMAYDNTSHIEVLYNQCTN